MRRFLVGVLVLVPLVAVACGDDDDDSVVQAGGTGGSGGSSGSSGEAGEGGQKEPRGGSSGTSPGGVGGQSGDGGRSSGGEGGREGDECVREYDLPHYDGDTSGLCDAAEVNRCDNRCGDIGEALSVLCAPDKSGCIFVSNICGDGTECGWIDCEIVMDDPELCEEMKDVIHDVSQTGPHNCVRDEDCPAPSTCSRRIYNMMVCDPIEWSQGGNGGEGGA